MKDKNDALLHILAAMRDLFSDFDYTETDNAFYFSCTGGIYRMTSENGIEKLRNYDVTKYFKKNKKLFTQKETLIIKKL